MRQSGQPIVDTTMETASMTAALGGEHWKSIQRPGTFSRGLGPTQGTCPAHNSPCAGKHCRVMNRFRCAQDYTYQLWDKRWAGVSASSVYPQCDLPQSHSVCAWHEVKGLGGVGPTKGGDIPRKISSGSTDKEGRSGGRIITTFPGKNKQLPSLISSGGRRWETDCRFSFG